MCPTTSPTVRKSFQVLWSKRFRFDVLSKGKSNSRNKKYSVAKKRFSVVKKMFNVAKNKYSRNDNRCSSNKIRS